MAESTEEPRIPGDYLGARCEACGREPYANPSRPADTPESVINADLGEDATRDPHDGVWYLPGVVTCAACGDTRERWISEGEVEARREANRVRFVEAKAQQIMDRMQARSGEDGRMLSFELRDVLIEALEENWGPLAEVIDRIAEQDGEHGIPLWGHPFWTTKLSVLLGQAAMDAAALSHPGNEFEMRFPGQVDMVQLEPPAETGRLRDSALCLAAMAVRWIIAIDMRADKESDAEAEAQQVIDNMAEAVAKWQQLAAGTLIPGDEEERVALTKSGQKAWGALSLSLAPGAAEALSKLSIRPATVEEVRSVFAAQEAQETPEEAAEPEEPATVDQIKAAKAQLDEADGKEPESAPAVQEEVEGVEPTPAPKKKTAKKTSRRQRRKGVKKL